MKFFLLSTLLALPVFAISLPAQSQRYYVKADAGGAQTGANWAEAFSDLQAALQLAQAGDTVWVAAGVYYPTAGNDRSVAFEPLSGVSLLGGFAGTENLPGQRDWTLHPVILSGDIGTPGDSTDNSLNIMYLDNPDSTTLIDGFIFRYGNADNPDPLPSSRHRSKCGAGLYVMAQDGAAYPSIFNCRFERNYALNFGGGLCVNGAGTGSVAPLVWNCVFAQNRAGLDGGGMARLGGSWVERAADWRNGTFSDNRAGRNGGGLYASDSERKDTFDMEHCNFLRNTAGQKGGGAFLMPNRFAIGSAIKIIGCNFEENWGAGTQGADLNVFTNLFAYLNHLTMDSCVFKNNLNIQGTNVKTFIEIVGITNTSFQVEPFKIQNCIFNNLSGYSSGLFQCELIDAPEVRFEHNTFLNNAGVGKLLAISHSLSACFLNTTIFNNSRNWVGVIHIPNVRIINMVNGTNGIENAGLDFEKCDNVKIDNLTFLDINQNGIASIRISNYTHLEIFNSVVSVKYDPTFDLYNNSTATITHTYLNFPDCATFPSGVTCGPGLIFGGDPMFRDSSNGDFSLLPCSPLIDAGINQNLPGVTGDLAGNPRVQGAAIDMGCYEAPAYQLSATPAVVPACEGFASGAVSLLPASGCAPYTFAWEAAGASGTDTTGLAPGVYAFTVTDSRGRSIEQTVTIFSSPTPLLQPMPTPVFCGAQAGGTAAAAVTNGAPPYNFTWSSGATDSLLAALGPGQYPLTVTDHWGCRDSVIIEVALQGLLNLRLDELPITCFQGQNGTLTAATLDGKSPFAFAWAHGPLDSVVTGLGPGTYSVTATDAWGCTAALSITLTEPDTLQFTAAVTDASGPQAADGAVTVTSIEGGTPPYQYAWTDGQAGDSLSGLTPGFYTLTLSDQNACTAAWTFEVKFITGTDENAGIIGTLILYPNPTADALTLSGRQTGEPFLLEIFDAAGREVLTQRIAENGDKWACRLSVESLSAGIYSVRVLDARGGLIGRGRFVKQ